MNRQLTTNNPHYIELQAQLSRQRRELGSQSPETFANIYLASHCPLAMSRMHREIFADLSEIITKRDGRLAVAAPRGHAKSTIVSLAFVLWCVLYEKEKFILIVSAMGEQAELLLKPIKDELRTNPLLLADFPEACVPEGARKQPSPWRRNRIRLPNGAMIAAHGAGQGLRGAKNAQSRPGLIVVDDIEDRDQVVSENQRIKTLDWFKGTLLHAGRPGTNVIVVGTLLHYDSLLSNLVHPNGPPGWQRRVFQAVEQHSDRPDLWDQWGSIFGGRETFEEATGVEAAAAFYRTNEAEMLKGTRVLWPELEDYQALMVMREREGRASFQAEKQNEPLDPEQCVFSEKRIQFWDEEFADEQALFDSTKKDGWIFGACDPAMGRKGGKGEYSAIVILYLEKRTNIRYVIAADIARRSPDQTIERILQYAKMYRMYRFLVEGNHFQELMFNNPRRRVSEAEIPMIVNKINNQSNKQMRIAAIEPLLSQGLVKLNRRHHRLLDQLRQFPLAAHDDGPDALEMAINASRYRPRPMTSAPICRIPDWIRNRKHL